MNNEYQKIKLLGVFLLPIFQFSLILDGFRFSIFKDITSFYNLLYPYVLVSSVLLLTFAIYKESFSVSTKRTISTTDKVINFVGCFYILMNIVISIFILTVFET
ncbi:hypothetical protein Q4575_19495 [Psychrosphaera sp. 1_MG-2023]|uniref:hypothetical protein n=1 Tax=Psychrosphaera sp. 1_MG-2023 TaxID=3062643 RepID=UPI0026E46867|nr:hypothetical protein [Psychrosphaera sp. 1_MG-2023]MDO6721593.1 hypothetical protein [Psychrosphaera sp. 1_MG-2023]